MSDDVKNLLSFIDTQKPREQLGLKAMRFELGLNGKKITLIEDEKQRQGQGGMSRKVARDGNDSDEEMRSTMRNLDTGQFLRVDEFRMKDRKTNKNLFHAYENMEVTDFFKFNDREGLVQKDPIQLEELQEIESHRPKQDCLINDFDVEIIGDDDDCQLLGSFKPESLLYNLQKEIKVDRADIGQMMLKNVKMQETKVKMEAGDTQKSLFPGKTISMKNEPRLRVKSEAAS